MKLWTVRFSLIIAGFTSSAAFSAEEPLNQLVSAFCAQEACVPVACSKKFLAFLGTWEGDFETYDQALGGFRPYHNQVTYVAKECLKSARTGDEFIIGRKTDRYPTFKNLAAKISYGLMITGKRADGTPFLATIDGERRDVYQLVYQNAPAELGVWKLEVPAVDNQPAMTFTVIDGRDEMMFGVNKRNVTITLESGTVGAPGAFSLVIARGSHTLKAK